MGKIEQSHHFRGNEVRIVIEGDDDFVVETSPLVGEFLNEKVRPKILEHSEE